MPAEEQEPQNDLQPRQSSSVKAARLFSSAVELPVVLVAGILIGGGIGWWIDHAFGTGPWLMLLLGLIGFGAGLREIVRKLSKDNS